MQHQNRWTVEKTTQRIKLVEKHVYWKHFEILPFRIQFLGSPQDPPPVSPNLDDSSWEVIPVNTYWGKPRADFILRTTFSVPAINPKDGPIALYLPIGDAHDFSHPEALVYLDGKPFAAVDRHHQEVTLPNHCLDGKEHSLALHGWTGSAAVHNKGLASTTPTRLFMRPCAVVQVHQQTRDFISLARVALGIAEKLDAQNPARYTLLTILDSAFQKLDIREPLGMGTSRPYESIEQAFSFLRQGIEKAGPPLDVHLSAIGHAHIDIAWLWTVGQARQKAGRTFYNVLRLMEAFPEYIFGQSQPQLYDYIRKDYPKLFEAIKDRVAEGRWETMGGMWVEADCNLSGSESLARQFLLGRSFFRKHFGEDADSPVLWLPDVFGYAWNLPQLIKEAGMEYFFTIKIGWNQYNRLPYDSFWWQGLDGTKVLTHFSTTRDANSIIAATYNSDASPSQVLGTWDNFQQKDVAAGGESLPLLMSYGWGDGGGGPTREMLENLREMADFPAAPKIRLEKVADFFARLNGLSINLPTWNGELYLEYHRGTYTTQARNKKANRQSEFLLHDAEFLATYASLVDADYQYPHSQFTNAWQMVCLNQFHDIIPGSSIGPVYDQSQEQYAEIRRIAEEIKYQAITVLANNLRAESVIINPSSFARNEIIQLGNHEFSTGELPPYSISPLALVQEEKPVNNSSISAISSPLPILENDFLRVEFNTAGDITGIFDKIAQREVLPEGAVANQFLAFEDRPINYDAWDIDIFYEDKAWLADPAKSITVVESSSYRAVLEFERKILNSTFTQQISLVQNSPRLDFATQIDWQERHILLKTAFPVDILSPTATHEIQWGNVERPTHRNTSWDWARFETAAQKWVDLSEGGYGVSLLNDCKYGHDVQANVIRLSLLRSPTSPDPNADRGKHRFKYSLLTHKGKWGMDTVREAYALNDPLIFHNPNGVPQEKNYSLEPGIPFVSINQKNIVIETIKGAEDGNGVIIRLYECQRKRCDFTLETMFPIQQAWRANILEENQVKIPTSGNQICYQIKPFQIITLRVFPEE